MKGSNFWYRVKSLRRLPAYAQEVALNAYDAHALGEFSRLLQTVRPYTMCSNVRLRALHRAVKHVEGENIPGAVVECGTARGGSAALMGLTLKGLGSDRTLWVFDTFEGLPPATEDDPSYARFYTGDCRGEYNEVAALLDHVGVLPQSRLVKGLVQDTLPVTETGPIAVLHIDTDWYDSVKVCLDTLYERVSPGGIIQLDDYGYWEGARKATEDFRRERRLDSGLRRIDFSARQIVKA